MRGANNQKENMTAGKVIRRILLVIGTLLLSLIITVFAACFMIVYGPSPSLRDMLVLSAMQASATKWAPGLFMSKEAVDEIIANSEKVNTDVLDVDDYPAIEDKNEWDDAIDGMKLLFIQEPKYKAYILLIKDPARIRVGTSSDHFNTATVGAQIFKVAERFQAVAAMNGGEFEDKGGMGSGARPCGLTYSFGECVWNDGLRRTFIGFDQNNKLICASSMTKEQADKRRIRDAVSFQNGNVLIEQVDDEVKLYYSDKNTGTSQRTAIGQRADGTVIFLVTDGRTAESIGATKNDVIDTLVSYGAVSAAMLDGGSSSMLYYKDYFNVYKDKVDLNRLDNYQMMGLVNNYKAFTKPRYIPTYFIVTEK